MSMFNYILFRICNYVYNLVIDPEKLNQLDTKEKNKKKRYNLRRDIEKFYADRNSQEFLNKEQSLGKKISYNRYKNIEERGYDILNLEKSIDADKIKKSLKNQKQPWDILTETLGDNPTLNSEKVYKNPYDSADYKKSLSSFKKTRNSNRYFKNKFLRKNRRIAFN